MSSNYVVEKVFEHSGFLCVVAMMDMGHRCGYVGVPKPHKYYGKNYRRIADYIDCHGGLTYSGGRNYPLADRDDLWWFGWDYAHLYDGIDWESFEKNFDREIVNRRREWAGSGDYYNYRYSIEDVEEDCKSVAEQLKEKNNV